jgi:hypothetical protein
MNEVWRKKFIFRSAKSREQSRLPLCNTEMDENTVLMGGFGIGCTVTSLSELVRVQSVDEPGNWLWLVADPD